MPDSEAKKRWKRENTKNLVININRNTDKEIFDYLETLNEPFGKKFKDAIKKMIQEEQQNKA